MVIDYLRNFFKTIVKEKEEEDLSSMRLKSLDSIRDAFENMDIVLSDAVELEFKDPRKIGIIDSLGNHTTLTRFNPEEFENRVVKGIVARVWKEANPLNQWLIEVSTQLKLKNDVTVTRKFVFLDNEIEWIRKLQ